MSGDKNCKINVRIPLEKQDIEKVQVKKLALSQSLTYERRDTDNIRSITSIYHYRVRLLPKIFSQRVL